jgi:quinol monooxygenase YgiN
VDSPGRKKSRNERKAKEKHMAVWEVARLTVAPGDEEKFESIVRAHLPIFKADEGSHNVKLLRAVDKEGVFLLCILWESIEYHHDVFMKTEEFATFSGAVRPFFTAPPETLHATAVIDGI